MILSPVPLLREGDTIAVVAPAGPVPMERLKPALALLKDRFRLSVPEDIGRRQGFLAGSDSRRADEFNQALRDPEVRAIWAARGGYGCSRIVDDLDGDALRADPKPIVGFSDLTVLLCWAARVGVQSIHGPVLTQFGELSASDQRWMLDLITKGCRGEVLGSAGEALSSEVAEGPLLGGNLSILSHLCGTALALDFRGALCVLEDVGERPYAIDRYLGQLLAQTGAGALRGAAAVLLGDFAKCGEPSDDTIDPIETARVRLQSAGLLCASGLAVGHGDANRAFPVGGAARLEQGRVVLL